MIHEYNCNKLSRDAFGIPILPVDIIKANNDQTINVSIFVFTDISPLHEKYVQIEYKNVSIFRKLPPFTYRKPDPQGEDPRNIGNVVYIDERSQGIIRKDYILIDLIPNSEMEYKEIWGMRNHLHKSVTVKSPGILCAKFDENLKTWSVRNYFEIENLEFLNENNKLEICQNLMRNIKSKELSKSLNIIFKKISRFLLNNKIILKMRENLYTQDGLLPLNIDNNSTLKKLKLAFTKGNGYVAIDNSNEPIGYVTWEYHDKNHKFVSEAVFISELYVFPEYRMRGIGSKLVEYVLNDERIKNNKIWLTHDPEELCLTYFYKKFGFKVEGKTDVGNIIMIKY